MHTHTHTHTYTHTGDGDQLCGRGAELGGILMHTCSNTHTHTHTHTHMHIQVMVTNFAVKEQA